MNFSGWEVLVSKKVKFKGIFAWPLIFYRQKLCKIIFASLKNLFSVICGFRIPDSGFRFRIPVPDSGFRFPGFRVARRKPGRHFLLSCSEVNSTGYSEFGEPISPRV